MVPEVGGKYNGRIERPVSTLLRHISAYWRNCSRSVSLTIDEYAWKR